MQEVCDPLPKRNAPSGAEEGTICSVNDGVAAAQKNYPAGKLLFVSDAGAYAVFAGRCDRRAVSVVLDRADALPLFSMPDGVSCILAAGSGELMRAARYYAGAQNIGCALFPSEATLAGAFEPRGEVSVGGERETALLPPAQVYCDPELVKPTLARAYARLLLSRLAYVEARALRVFRGGEGGEKFSGAFEAFGNLQRELTAREVLEMSLQLRKCERDGMPAGEGIVLAEILGGGNGEWRAFVQLLGLYSAFFAKGRPRRYRVPDYRARAAAAGTEYREASIPTAGEYARRAIALERTRAGFLRDMTAIAKGAEIYRRTVCGFSGGEPPRAGKLDALKLLPERCPEGLSAVIRDFGLMEF